jgi:hypothetical protein
MEDTPTTLWTLRRGDKEIACRVRLLTYGIEVDLTSDGEALVTRVFDTGEEALAWAEQKRVRRVEDGWYVIS